MGEGESLFLILFAIMGRLRKLWPAPKGLVAIKAGKISMLICFNT